MPATSENPSDLIALHNLYGRLTHAWDSGSGERFADLCTDDIELRRDQETIAMGRSQLVELTHSVATSQPGLRHLVSTVYVDVDGNDAVGHASLVALRPTPEGLIFAGLAEYEDAFVRLDGAWVLRRRQVVRLAPAAAGRSFVMAPG